MSFVIEHGVPVPLRGGKKKYPFDDMAVGDSFKFPEEDRVRVFASAKARACAPWTPETG